MNQLLPHEGGREHHPAVLQDELQDAQDDIGAAEGSEKANVHGLMQLKDLKCPTCHAEQKVAGMKLRTRTGFSELKCKVDHCGEVALSNIWRCRCNLLWTRCPRHYHEVAAPVRRTRHDHVVKRKREVWRGPPSPGLQGSLRQP